MLKNHGLCKFCGLEKKSSALITISYTRNEVAKLIKKRFADWSDSDLICQKCINDLRIDYVRQLLEQEKGELSSIDKEVVQSLSSYETITDTDPLDSFKSMTFGQKLSDKIADFGGSWYFISLFFFLLVLWMFVNATFISEKPFDPYPFILLNLILSSLAAFQAPIIMMSQKRQESRDRLNAENDYKVNLKAELEIRHINMKIDQLLTHQWQHLLEIQQIQIELIQEISKNKL